MQSTLNYVIGIYQLLNAYANKKLPQQIFPRVPMVFIHPRQTMRIMIEH